MKLACYLKGPEGAWPSSGCLTSFSSPPLCLFAQALFFAPPLQVTFPMQIMRLDNSLSQTRLRCPEYTKSRKSTGRESWIYFGAGGVGGGWGGQGWSVPLPSPPLSSPLSRSLQLSALLSPVLHPPLCYFSPSCSVILLFIIIVPNNTALGGVTNQKHPRIAQQRVKCNFEFKISDGAYFRSPWLWGDQMLRLKLISYHVAVRDVCSGLVV